MKVLHVSPAFFPATYWGGPIFSVYGLCNAVAADPQIKLRVLSCDTAGPKRSSRVPVDGVPMRFAGGYDVYFSRRVWGRDIAPGLITRLFSLVAWADVVHLTGVYSFPTIPTLLACRLMGKPLVWSPRGSLQASEEWDAAGNLRLKTAFEWLCRRLMPQRTVLHVTADVEKSASQRRMPGLDAVVIPNGVHAPHTLTPREWRPGGRLRLMYLGRLHSKKGIENLLHAMVGLPDQITLDIYGLGDRPYTQSLEQLVTALNLTTRVAFHGEALDEIKTCAFLSADLFVLPSYSENFGNVVAEALAHGVPVLVSKSTPWAEVEVRGCGRWTENASDVLMDAISELSRQDLADMGLRGRAWMMTEYTWHALADRMVAVYKDIASSDAPHRGSTPTGDEAISAGADGKSRLGRGL